MASEGEIDPESGAVIPPHGQWPIPPQSPQPLDPERLWVDGCFDFSHHGHAGALLQARRLGRSVYVGIHSDEAILANKGPTVMTLAERVAAVEACRWVSRAVPHAPYVTSLPWISHYGCEFVVHGDDVTSDADGADCYRFVKRAGRMKIVRRTPGISTTDLVGRMLLCTRAHFVRDLDEFLEGHEGQGDGIMARREMVRRYATAEDGWAPKVEIWRWRGDQSIDLVRNPRDRVGGPGATHKLRDMLKNGRADGGGEAQRNGGRIENQFTKTVDGKPPREGQRIVYVDGGFDLFCSGHIEFLRQVIAIEEDLGRQRGWYQDAARQDRLSRTGEDYDPAYVIAGVHDDTVINHWKGVNYPIMNIFERGLCVLQCKHISAVVFSAPFTPTSSYLRAMPYGLPAAVYHGPTSFVSLPFDPYAAPKQLGIFSEVAPHDYQHVNAGEIVERILKSKELYEERQRIKGVKGVGEEAVRKGEMLEKETDNGGEQGG